MESELQAREKIIKEQEERLRLLEQIQVINK
jgi:hypothetical protein